MTESDESPITFARDSWFRKGHGPRYLLLYRYVASAIISGQLQPGHQLPAERRLAEIANVSRVTIRKAIAGLVADGLLEQRRGAGTFVRGFARPKLEQSLSSLISFSENMRMRGWTSSSVVLNRGIYAPNPDESVALGFGANGRVSRIKRLRSADDVPVAIEHSSLPVDILPDPGKVAASLYEVLRAENRAPTRAIQRVAATNLGMQDASHLKMPEGAAVLRIDRIAYLPTGRPIEFTWGLYRSDIYDFVAELRLES